MLPLCSKAIFRQLYMSSLSRDSCSRHPLEPPLRTTRFDQLVADKVWSILLFSQPTLKVSTEMRGRILGPFCLSYYFYKKNRKRITKKIYKIRRNQGCLYSNLSLFFSFSFWFREIETLSNTSIKSTLNLSEKSLH